MKHFRITEKGRQYNSEFMDTEVEWAMWLIQEDLTSNELKLGLAMVEDIEAETLGEAIECFDRAKRVVDELVKEGLVELI